jgi:hypothetical protein
LTMTTILWAWADDPPALKVNATRQPKASARRLRGNRMIMTKLRRSQ